VTNIINFSGHALSERATSQLEEKFGDINIETVKISLSRRRPLFSQIIEIMLKLKTNLNDGSQPITVLPGMSIASSLVLSYIHGASGMFPKVIELLRSDSSGAYEVNDVHDLEFYRHGARRSR